MADARLPDDMLARFAERAPVYDRENSFFTEDFEELRQAGYLTMAVPAEMDKRRFFERRPVAAP